MDNFSKVALSLENIMKHINKIKSKKMSEYGIRPAHFDCMMHIDMSDEGLTPTELSKDCGVDKAFISRTTADLIKSGFIQINKKFSDGRKYRNKYILTEDGKNVIKETRDLVEKQLRDMCVKINEFDMKVFIKMVLSINDVIDSKKKAKI